MNLNERRVFTGPVVSAGHYSRQKLTYEGEELILAYWSDDRRL